RAVQENLCELLAVPLIDYGLDRHQRTRLPEQPRFGLIKKKRYLQTATYSGYFLLWRGLVYGKRGCTAGFRSYLCPLGVIRDREGRSRTAAYVRFAPKADAANDRRAAMLHWMTLSAASRPLALRGRIDHISAGRVVRRCEALAPFVFRFRRTRRH